MQYQEVCFYCGTPMINGVCPDCGYQYPFAFECPYHKGISCTLTRKPCTNSEEFISCEKYNNN